MTAAPVTEWPLSPKTCATAFVVVVLKILCTHHNMVTRESQHSDL